MEKELIQFSPFKTMIESSVKRWQDYMDGKIKREETNTLDMLYWIDSFKK